MYLQISQRFIPYDELCYDKSPKQSKTQLDMILFQKKDYFSVNSVIIIIMSMEILIPS